MTAPDFTAEENRILACKEFAELVERDPEIAQLEKQNYDKDAHARALMEVLGLGTFHIGKLPVMPLTAAKWAFLWMLDSPFVIGGNVTQADLNIALYILSEPDLRKLTIALHELPGVSAAYSTATGLECGEIMEQINALIHTAFQPLEMLPSSGPSDDVTAYDAVWLATIAGCASRELNIPFNACMHELSLSSLCACFVSWRRRESMDANKIRYRTSAEIDRQILARVNELGREFLLKNTAGPNAVQKMRTQNQ